MVVWIKSNIRNRKNKPLFLDGLCSIHLINDILESYFRKISIKLDVPFDEIVELVFETVSLFCRSSFLI